MTNRLDDFQRFLRRQNLRPATVENTVKRINTLLQRVTPLTPQTFEDYIYKLKDEGKSNAYLNSLIMAVKKYWEFTGENYMPMKTFSVAPTTKAILSDKEIEKFLALNPHPKAEPKRFYEITLFFEIMAYCGCRPAELQRLKTYDVDFGRNVFILRETKTHDTREVPIPPNLKDKLTKYLQGLTRENVFDVSNACWHYQFQQRIKRAGIPKRKNLSAYSLRHSYATELVNSEVSVFQIKRLLGHKNIHTTENYVHLATKDLQKAILKHPLIAKKTSAETQINLIYEFIKAMELEQNFNVSVEKNKNEIKVRVTS